MKKWMAWMLTAVLALSCGLAGAEKFVQGIDPEYPPFSYLNDQGEYAGFDVDIAKAACEIAGLEYEVFPVDWTNKLIQLDNHECDVIWSGMTIMDSMKEQGYVISEPYFYNTQVLVVKKDSGIASSADLAGKAVAVMLGTSGESLLNDPEGLQSLKDTFGELVTCESFLACFTELEGNAVDAVFVDLPVAVSYAAGKDQLQVLNEDLGAEYYGLAFRTEDAELCAKIESAVQTLVENGTYAEIAARYPDIDPQNLLFLKAE